MPTALKASATTSATNWASSKPTSNTPLRRPDFGRPFRQFLKEVVRGSYGEVPTGGSWFVVRGSCGSRLVGAVLEGGPRESCVKRYRL